MPKILKVHLMTSATKIRATVRRMTLNLRAIHRLVQSDDFVHLWLKTSSENRKKAEYLISKSNIFGFKEWFKQQRKADLRDMPYRELLTLCQRHHIKNYSRMMKDEMVEALSERGINDRTST
jgi:hypothetical protein